MRLFRIRSHNTLSDGTESVLIGGCAQNRMRYAACDVEDNAAPTFGLCSTSSAHLLSALAYTLLPAETIQLLHHCNGEWGIRTRMCG